MFENEYVFLIPGLLIMTLKFGHEEKQIDVGKIQRTLFGAYGVIVNYNLILHILFYDLA